MNSWLRRFLIGMVILLALTIPVAAAQGTPPSYVAYQWHTFFGGDGGVEANLPATVVDAYGNLYATGQTQYPWDQYGNPASSALNYWDAYLTKISPTGQLLWTQFYPNSTHPNAITLDPAGNIYIAGSNNTVNGGCFVMETDPSGNMIGAVSNFGSGIFGATCSAYGITYDTVQNFAYITGMAGGWWLGGQPVNGLPTNGATAMFIVQAQGVAGGVGLGWVGFYYTADTNGGGTNAYGRAITIDASSNLIVAGTENGNWDAAVWKVSSSSGQQAWEAAYAYGSGISYAVALYGSSVYVTGSSPNGWNGPLGQAPLNAFAYGGSALCCRAVAFVLKLDTGGNYAWHTFYYGYNWQSIGEGIAVDGPTTVYVDGPGDIVGYGGAPPLYNGDGGHFILQLDDTGAYKWHSLYGVGRYDLANSIAVDPLHDVYVSGYSWGNWNGDNNTPPLHAASATPDSVFVMKFGTAATVATTTTAGSVTPITYSTNSQTITLSATVTSTSTVNSGTVSFTLLSTAVSASVTGGFATTSFTVPGGTVAGNYTIQAAYVPGTGLAASSDNSQQLVISKATPVITWSNPAGIVYGAALGSTQLNATASVPGTFVYTPPAGTVLQAGNGQTLSTTFTPTDTTDYNTAPKSVLINVSKATPVITWPAPAAITYGGALGNGQLDASANTPGTFVYTPPAGTVLPVGKGQTLSVAFTPSDAVDYTTASGSTTIDVNAAPPPTSGVNLVVTKVLTRTGGNVVVLLTIANTGGTAANNVTLTSVKVGTTSATPLPQNLGTIGASASVQATVSVPGSVGVSGAASSLTVAGTYTGGTFSSSMRITLP